MSRAVKIRELDGKNVIAKGETESLRGRVTVINPEESEIAKNLGIKEKGVYGIKFK